MTDAFLLGAGFSKAIGPSMPVTNELGKRALDQLKSLHRSRVLPDQHGSRCDGISCDGLTPTGGFLSQALDFEQWLTTLAEPQPYLLEPANARRQALFSELTGAIATVIDQSVDITMYGQEPPQWLGDLVTLWHRVQAHVLTFNYDTLVEATLDHLTLTDADGAERTIHLNIGPSVIPNWVPMFDGMRLRPTTSFRYWKLHGSTHWYWDDTTKAADSIVQIGLKHEWGNAGPSFDDEEREFRAPGKVPMIVPPTSGKSVYFNNPVIRYLWHDAFYGLLQARRVFVFGYSLPPGDLLVRSMLTELLSNKEVWIINPSLQVLSNFEGMSQNLNVEFCHPELNAEDFVHRYRELVS